MGAVRHEQPTAARATLVSRHWGSLDSYCGNSGTRCFQEILLCSLAHYPFRLPSRILLNLINTSPSFRVLKSRYDDTSTRYASGSSVTTATSNSSTIFLLRVGVMTDHRSPAA